MVAALSIGFAAGAIAQKTARDIPVETFLKRGQYRSMELFFDGSRLASLAPLTNRFDFYRRLEKFFAEDLKWAKRRMGTEAAAVTANPGARACGG